MALFSKLGKYSNTALLLMRIGIGTMMILHGYPKLLAGKELWTKLGSNMTHIGITAYPEIWGFLASVSETIGGLLILIGFFFRPAAFFILFTMFIASMSHIYKDGNIKGAYEAIELASVFIGFFIMGPGKYSIDKS